MPLDLWISCGLCGVLGLFPSLLCAQPATTRPATVPATRPALHIPPHFRARTQSSQLESLYKAASQASSAKQWKKAARLYAQARKLQIKKNTERRQSFAFALSLGLSQDPRTSTVIRVMLRHLHNDEGNWIFGAALLCLKRPHSFPCQRLLQQYQHTFPSHKTHFRWKQTIALGPIYTRAIQGKVQQAITQVNSYVRKHPTDAQALFLKAHILRMFGDSLKPSSTSKKNYQKESISIYYRAIQQAKPQERLLPFLSGSIGHLPYKGLTGHLRYQAHFHLYHLYETQLKQWQTQSNKQFLKRLAAKTRKKPSTRRPHSNKPHGVKFPKAVWKRLHQTAMTLIRLSQQAKQAKKSQSWMFRWASLNIYVRRDYKTGIKWLQRIIAQRPTARQAHAYLLGIYRWKARRARGTKQAPHMNALAKRYLRLWGAVALYHKSLTMAKKANSAKEVRRYRQSAQDYLKKVKTLIKKLPKE